MHTRSYPYGTILCPDEDPTYTKVLPALEPPNSSSSISLFDFVFLNFRSDFIRFFSRFFRLFLGGCFGVVHVDADIVILLGGPSDKAAHASSDTGRCLGVCVPIGYPIGL